MAKGRIPVDVDMPTWGRIRTELVVEPSPGDLRRMFERNSDIQLRGVAARGTCYVFDGHTATHAHVRRALGLDCNLSEGCDFWIVAEGAEIFSHDWDSDGLTRDGMTFVKGRGEDPGLEKTREWFERATVGAEVSVPAPGRRP